MCSAWASKPQAIKNQSNPVVAKPGNTAPKRSLMEDASAAGVTARPAVQEPPHPTLHPTDTRLWRTWSEDGDEDYLLDLHVPQARSRKGGMGSSEDDGEWP